MSSDVFAAMDAVSGHAVEYLSKVITDAAPLLEIEQRRMMPAAYWANRIYGDASRAEELAKRNDAPHPLFLPLQFEALSA